MKLHEYQSKGLFGQYASSVPKGSIVDFLERAVEADLGTAAGAKAAKDLYIDHSATKQKGSKVGAGAKASAAAGEGRRS
jgi:hypothetical protein